MTDTWSVFNGSDLFLGLLGAAGFISMIVVVATASSRVGKREVILSQARKLQNLEPEEKVLQELEESPGEVGPGHFTQGYGFFGADGDDRIKLEELKEHGDKNNYDTYSK